MKKTLKGISDYLGMLLITISICLLGYFIFDALYPSKLLVFDYNVVPVERQFTTGTTVKVQNIHTFYSGDRVPLRMKGRRYSNAIPIITFHMIDTLTGGVFSASTPDGIKPSPVSSGKGLFDFVSWSYIIPVNCYSGKFCFSITYTFPPRNFLASREVYRIKTEEFNVVALDSLIERANDEALIRQILKEMRIKPGVE